MATTKTTSARVDVYTRATDRIIEELERGTRPWLKPWNAQHAAGRITRPLRHNVQPYNGINILMLWASAETQGFVSPFWRNRSRVETATNEAFFRPQRFDIWDLQEFVWESMRNADISYTAS